MLYCEAADDGGVPHCVPDDGGGGVLPHCDEGTPVDGIRVIPLVGGTGDVLEGGGVMFWGAVRVWLGGAL